MTELSAALFAELQQPRPLIFGWVTVQFQNYTLRLVDGSGEVMMGGQRFVGRDPTYGVLDSIKGLADKIDGRAPEVSIGFIPSGDVALNLFLDPSVQGAPVSIGLGAVNMATGQAVDAGYPLFAGYLDVPTVTWGDNDRRLEFKCTSIGERLFNIEEGRRLSNAFHQRVWPGENGLKGVTGLEQQIYWGQNAPSQTSTGGYGGGGGSDFNSRQYNQQY